jgi:hypothetical protein
MKKVWHKAKPDLFRSVAAEIDVGYHDLRVVIENDVVYIRGSFPVKDDSGQILDRFLIEIQFPDDFPNSTPILRETGGRIPWFSDRHVNRDTGEACPIVPEEWLLRSDRASIAAFLAGPVQNFFLGQILFEHGEPWPFGERKHGNDGLFQSYGEWVGAKEPAKIRVYLEYLSRESLKGHWECPCGSQQKLRNCHLEELVELRKKIPSWIAKRALQRLGFSHK